MPNNAELSDAGSAEITYQRRDNVLTTLKQYNGVPVHGSFFISNFVFYYFSVCAYEKRNSGNQTSRFHKFSN